jgi:hypothetical protein
MRRLPLDLNQLPGIDRLLQRDEGFHHPRRVLLQACLHIGHRAPDHRPAGPLFSADKASTTGALVMYQALERHRLLHGLRQVPVQRAGPGVERLPNTKVRSSGRMGNSHDGIH